MSLAEMDFANVYIGKEVYITGPRLAKNPQTIDPSLVEGLKEKCEEIHRNTGKKEFSVELDNVRFRASLIQTVTEVVYACRKMPDHVKLFSDLGIFNDYANLFLKPDLTGLILIAGEFGHGKTWSASGLVSERLNLFGGVAVTLEDPVEMPLQGTHGSGICFQTEVEKNQFGIGMHRAARWAPDIIYVSELRDEETVIEALRAAINGKLVISTLHGDTVISAIERIYNFAKGTSNSADDVSSLMASALCIVAHQKLENEGGDVVPMLKPLLFKCDDCEAARNLVKERSWSQLNSEISRQMNAIRIQGTT